MGLSETTSTITQPQLFRSLPVPNTVKQTETISGK
jgi:hypothetical protein